MEDNDEKTVERSPDPSGGNGGELDLLGRKTLSRDKYITFWYLVRGEGMGDIEAGVPETAQRWSDLEVTTKKIIIIIIYWNTWREGS